LEFKFNFTSSILNFTRLVVAEQNQSDSRGAIVISGVNVTNKTVYLDDISSIDYICIKDSEGARIGTISSRCNLADETMVECDNTTDSGYLCEELNGTYRITGLSHTAIREQEPYVAPKKKSSSSSSSSSSSFYIPPCISNYTCGNWSECDWTEAHFRICFDIKGCNKTNRTEYQGCSYDFCNDGIMDNDETGVDCGGGCDPCSDGNVCSADSDCVHSCINLTCQKKKVKPVYKKFTASVVENCTDGMQNQDEADIDCGGVCNPCDTPFDFSPYLWGLVMMLAIVTFIYIIFLYKD